MIPEPSFGIRPELSGALPYDYYGQVAERYTHQCWSEVNDWALQLNFAAKVKHSWFESRLGHLKKERINLENIKQNCIKCRYYFEEDKFSGECRRHAPVIYEEGYWNTAEEHEKDKSNYNGDIYKYRSVTGFPGTSPDNHCGDFKMIKKDKGANELKCKTSTSHLIAGSYGSL